VLVRPLLVMRRRAIVMVVMPAACIVIIAMNEIDRDHMHRRRMVPINRMRVGMHGRDRADPHQGGSHQGRYDLMNDRHGIHCNSQPLQASKRFAYRQGPNRWKCKTARPWALQTVPIFLSCGASSPRRVLQG
jgi:hypothetical protein